MSLNKPVFSFVQKRDYWYNKAALLFQNLYYFMLKQLFISLYGYQYYDNGLLAA